MKLRKLSKNEHGNTRFLWEQIFQEDSKDFLDYYYHYKANENEIYVIENKNSICAMLQLNPYAVHMGDNVIRSINYIVGVATAPEYRKQGLMKKLLHKSMKDMRDRKEPFVFLMPAAEAIYAPFDFRFIYKQNKMKINREDRIKFTNGQSEELTIVETDMENMEELAAYSEDILSRRYQLYMKRDVAYYKTLFHEQKCQNGGILLFYHRTQLVGYTFYENNDNISIRELVIEKKYRKNGISALCEYFNSEDKQIIITAFDSSVEMETTETRPLIMARILNLEEMAAALTSSEKISFTLGINDNIIPENNGIYQWEIDENGGLIIPVKEFEYSDTQKALYAAELPNEEIPCLEIHELTSFLFGYRELEDIIDIKSYQLLHKMQKINVLKKIFINEIV